MKSKSQIIEQLKKHKKEANRGLAKQRDNTRRCRAFRVGDYQEYTDKIQFTTPTGQKKRVTVQINKIKPYHAAVKGFLAQNRKKRKYTAIMQKNPAQDFYNKYCNTLSDHLRKKMNSDQVETQQDGDLLESGIGVVETAMTYGEGYASNSANGDIMMSCVDLDTYWWDPHSRQTNLLDRRYDGITKEYHLDEALSLFKDSEEEDFESDKDTQVSDYQQQSDLGSYDRIKYDWSDKKEKMVNVDFYQWYDIDIFYRAENPLSGLNNPQSKQAAMMELQSIAQQVAETDADFDPAADILAFNEETKGLLEEAFGEFIQPEEFRRKCFYTAVCSGDKCFTAFKSEYQEGYTRQVKTGDFDAKNKIWTGMINSMMEPQKYYNKALTELMFVIAANSKGGIIIEQGAVEDIEEFEDQYAKTDAVCVVRDGAIAGPNGPRLKDKRSPFQPTGYEQIIQIADNAMPDSAGIDKTFLGSSENKLETAKLQRQRIRQIVSVLACYVDSIDLFSIEHARLMLDLMRIYVQNHRGELFPAPGDDGVTVFIQMADDKLVDNYQIDTEESPVTTEERDEMADKFTAIGDRYIAAGNIDRADFFYNMAAKYMSLEAEDLQEINKTLSPQDGQADPAYVKQLEALIKQLQDKVAQAQVDNLNAMSNKAMHDAKKADSETQLNEVKAADLRSGIHKKAAETSKVLEDATGKHIENTFTKEHPKEVFAPTKPQQASV